MASIRGHCQFFLDTIVFCIGNSGTCQFFLHLITSSWSYRKFWQLPIFPTIRVKSMQNSFTGRASNFRLLAHLAEALPTAPRRHGTRRCSRQRYHRVSLDMFSCDMSNLSNIITFTISDQREHVTSFQPSFEHGMLAQLGSVLLSKRYVDGSRTRLWKSFCNDIKRLWM